MVYFLGDGYREYDELFNTYNGRKVFIGVKGNCDLGCSLPEKDIRNIDGKKIYATHGYIEKVKFGLFDLEDIARREKCDIVLFGHTHQPLNSYKDGVYYFNPGSIREGFYGVIDLTDKGIMCLNKNILSFY